MNTTDNDDHKNRKNYLMTTSASDQILYTPHILTYKGFLVISSAIHWEMQGNYDYDFRKKILCF